MDDHSRTIVHIDIDCFYAQVEMIKEPRLRNQPLGIQQKSIVVTSNYIAREYGITKCMPISEAKKLCPNLILVTGEDLYDYRQVSSKVSELLRCYSDLVERLGLDENFVDITELVNKNLEGIKNNMKSVGYTFGVKNAMSCDCGCEERVTIGSQIAQQMRDEIFEKLHLTTCAGIAHNKLLAKIVGTKNKPNKQTLLFPNSASELMLTLDNVRNIPWIGHASAELMKTININKVEDLQNCDMKQLESVFDSDKAQNFINLSFGIDNTPVKKSGKPQSIGLEDACKPLTVEKDVEQKLSELLHRLLVLVNEDGRIPKVLKVTIRKSDQSHPSGGIRETRQCNINIPLTNKEQLISVAMSLFRKIIDKSKMFKITLVGLSFSKFVDKPNHKNTLALFLTKSKHTVDTSVESPNLEPTPKRSKFSHATHLADNSNSNQAMENKAQFTVESNQEVDCPPGIDKDVFEELPPDVQVELWDDYKNRKERDKQMLVQKSSKKPNTMFNYVVRQSKK